MQKQIGWGLALTGLAGSLMLAAPAAHAGSASWGSASCAQGSLFTRATGNQTVYHEHRRNGTYYRKSFANGLTIKTNTYYTSLAVEDAASIQNGTGSLSGATRNCAD